ncbi:MAG: hypothetical protein H7843_09200 [Nitrospirota bacterium]
MRNILTMPLTSPARLCFNEGVDVNLGLSTGLNSGRLFFAGYYPDDSIAVRRGLLPSAATIVGVFNAENCRLLGGVA